MTHKWLEDCFVEWRNLTPAQKRYLDYAPGVNYGTVLGDRGVGRVGLEEEVDSLYENRKEPARPKDQPAQPMLKEWKKSDEIQANGGGLIGTVTSMREAVEVEEVEDALHVAGDPYGSHDDNRNGPPFSPSKLGPPRGIKKTPSKKGGPLTDVPFAMPKSRPPMDDDLLPLTKSKGSPDSGSNAKVPQAVLGAEPALVKQKSPMKIGPPMTAKAKSKSTLRTKSMIQQPDNDGSVVEISPPEPSAQPSHLRKESSIVVTVPAADSGLVPKAQKPRVLPGSASDPESIDELEPTGPTGKARAIIAVDSDEENDQEVLISHTKPKSKLKPTVYRRRDRVVPAQEEDENRSGTDEKAHETGKKKNRNKEASKVNGRQILFTSGSDNDDEIKLLAPKKVSRQVDSVNQRNRKEVLQPSPNRIVSVDLPDPRSLLASSLRGSSPDSVILLPKSVARLTKTRDRTSPNRRRPSVDRESLSRSPTPEPRRSPRRLRSDGTPASRNTATIRRDASPPAHRISHRHAAVTATQRLRDEVMPDVMNFENERRRSSKGASGRRRKSAQAVSLDGEEEEEQTDDSRDRKKRKITKHGGDKGSRGKALVKFDTEDSDEPSTRFVTNTKTKKRLADSDDDRSRPYQRSGQRETRKKIRRDRSVSRHE